MGRRRSSKQHKIETLCGTTYTPLIATTVASGSLALQPSQTGWGRAVTMAEIFQLFRFTKLKIHFLGPNANVNDIAVGVATGISDNPPASVSSVLQLEYCQINFGDQTTPSHLEVPRSFLIGQSSNKWWKTVSGAPPDWDELQGVIYGASTAGAATVNVFIEYEIEFCDFVNPAQTPSFVCVDADLGLYRSTKSLKGSDGPSQPHEVVAGTPVAGRVASQRVATVQSDRKG